MGTVGQFSVIFLPAFAHNSNKIYCRCSITQNIVKKRQPLFLASLFLPPLNHPAKHGTLRGLSHLSKNYDFRVVYNFIFPIRERRDDVVP